MPKASSAYRGAQPKSLNARLALLQWGILPVSPPKARASVPRRPGKTGRRLVGFSFGVGLACGVALGAAALLLDLPAISMPSSIPGTAALPDEGLGHVGNDARQVAGASSIGVSNQQASADGSLAPEAIPAIPDGQQGVAATRPRPPFVDTPFRTEVTAAPRIEEPVRTVETRPPLPDGMSTLGGPTGGPAAEPQHRTLWWKLPTSTPPPAWTPFANEISGN